MTQGFGEQLPSPWEIPPAAAHCAGVSRMQVSCTQHWIMLQVPKDFLASLTHTPLQQL
jgi:hypothetical protein